LVAASFPLITLLVEMAKIYGDAMGSAGKETRGHGRDDDRSVADAAASSRSRKTGPKLKISLFFSQPAGNLSEETGSTTTASAAT